MSDVQFFGETFRLVDEPSEWAMLEFAEAAGGSDANELAGLAAVMRLLRATVHEDDWQRFSAAARKNNAKIDRDLMPLVVAVFTGATDRPTVQPSGSSDGLLTTAPSSTADSSSPVTDPWRGARPELLALVEDSRAS